jgi:hypothetical protein
MTKRLLAVVPLALLLTGADWSELKLDEVKCTVKVPGPAKEVPQKADGAKARQYLVTTDGAAYVIYIREAPFIENATPEDIQAALAKGIEGAVKAVKGKAKGEPRDLKDGMHGHEVFVEMEGGSLLRMRVYAVGGHMVQTIVIGKEALVNGADANKFFESFKKEK